MPDGSQVLELDGGACAFLFGAVVDEVCGGHVFGGVAHGFVDGELGWGLAAWAAAEQRFAELGAEVWVEAG